LVASILLVVDAKQWAVLVPGDYDMRAALSLTAAFAFFSTCALSSGAFAQGAGDAAAGADVFKKCRACHDVGPGATNKVGPILNGLFGRQSGTVPGFKYSDPNREAGEKGLVWTEETFAKYIENPRAFIPGNTMAFVGIKDEQDRADLIAFLKTQK
jgi:cytochrome c